MQIDVVTRAALVVIALSLAIIAARPLVPEAAHAASDRGENVVKVQIVSIDESPNLAWEALPVTSQ